MPLHETQSQFMQSLMQSDFDEDVLLGNLKAGKRLQPARQLDIYRRNINGAMQGVLALVYPACCRILGEDYFNQLCRSYRFQYPSSHADLNLYGEYFSDFLFQHLAQHAQLVDFEYLPDLATLEWCWHAAYYCSDEQPFDFAGLQQVDDSQQSAVSFMLADSISLQQTNYPVIAIWEANRKETSTSQQFEHDGSELYYLIHRQEYEPQIEQLSMSDYTLLQSIKAGKAMGELSDQFEGRLNEQLPGYIQRGWISGYRLAST